MRLNATAAARTALLMLVCIVLAGCAAPRVPLSGTSAPAATATVALRKVPLVIANLSFYAVPIVLAQQKGYFAEEGYELETTTTGSGAKAVAALLGGSADLGVMEFSDIFGAVEKRQPVQVFAAMVTEPNVSIAMKKSLADASGLTDQSQVADKVKALKGKKIAITGPGSGTDSSLRWLLLNAGLDPERDVEIVPSGSASNELAAFAQGQVDAFAQTSPWVEQAIAKNGAFMVVSFPRGDVPEQRGRLSFALTTVKGNIDNKPELLSAATRAVWRSLKFIHDRPDEAKSIIKEALFANVDPEVYDTAWKMNLPSFPSDPRITPKHVQLTLEFRKRVSGEDSTVTFEQLATNQFVDAVASSIR